MDIDKRKKEFLELIESVGTPVIRQLLLEAIDYIKNKSKRNEIKQQLDELLPAKALASRIIMFNNQKYYLVFKPCSIEKYNLDDELNKIKSVIPEEKHEYFMNEVSITLSIVPNLYQRLMENNKDFNDNLINSLPENRKDILSNLIEYRTSTICMYEDGLHFALYVEKG